jgi:Uma2 family endonuclease
MAVTIPLLTAEQYLEAANRWSELIDGVIIDLSPPGGPHSFYQSEVIAVLKRAQAAGVGIAVGELGCIIRRNPDAVRAPDAAFIRIERLPTGRIPSGFWNGAPDLAVEVVSPSDRPGEIQTKIRDWIEAGARQVWIIYSDSRTVQVVRSLLDRVTLAANDTIDGGDAIPGFSCRVSELFGD